MIAPVYRKTFCRVCKGENLVTVIDLGSTPLANAFIKKADVDGEEKYFPLEVNYCKSCTFIQLGHVVSPKLLFSDYVYVSSTSPVFVKHFVDFADYAINKFNLDGKSLVIDIGSNDGILLKPFKENKIKVLGIEPAKKIATFAKKEGIPTLPNFINYDLAKKISKKYGKAKLITATNVFAHIDDLDEVVKSVDQMLDKEGVFMIEVAYLDDFIKKRYFDLIYHEHLCYWRVETFVKFFNRFNMNVIDAQYVAVHGGSIRIFVARKNSIHKISKSVEKFIEIEKKSKLQNLDLYISYFKKIEENKIELINLLHKLKINGHRIIGYEAPAKGNTLLNYFNIGRQTIDFIVDDSPWKQGLFSPGKKIPVKSSDELKKSDAKFMLILAWNFAGSIMQKNYEFSKRGGKFIIPVPKPKII